MLMPNRHESAGDYRYGFNGKEADDEIKEKKGTSYDFGARMYDPRVGRWLTIDPLAFKQPDQSPYKAMFNNPIFWNDPDGRTEYETTIFYHRDGSFEKVTRKISDNVISNGNSRRVFEYNGNSGFNRDYTDFYDYRQVTIYREREDGTFSVEFIKDDILVDNGVKRTRLGIFGKGSKYDPNAHWTGEGSGGKQNGGYRLTSKSGGASPTKQRSLTAAEEREIEALLALLGTKGGSLGGKGQDIIKDLSNLIEKAADVKDEYGDNSSSQDIPGNSNTMSNTVIWRMKNGKYRGSGDFATDKEKLEGDTLIGSYPEKHITITPAGDTLQGTPQQNGLNK
jgi:RHS repeat-associated protein